MKISHCALNVLIKYKVSTVTVRLFLVKYKKTFYESLLLSECKKVTIQCNFPSNIQLFYSK